MQLAIPTPCQQSWEAMTPTGPSRHCAACQQVVVDFTTFTDGELLAYLRGAAGREVCGRLRLDQLGRPLRPAPPTGAAGRWRSWLALALAAWGSSRAVAAPGPAPQPTHHVPAKATPRHRASTLAVKYVRGTVRDQASGLPLVGVAVFLKHENRRATTDSSGRFRLRLPARRPRGGRALVLHCAGYQSATVRVPATTKASLLRQLLLQPDPAAAGVVVVGQEHRRQEMMITGMMPLPGSAVLAEPPAQRAAPGFFRRLLRSLGHQPEHQP